MGVRPLPFLGLPRCLLGYLLVSTISSRCPLVVVVRLPVIRFVIVSRSPIYRPTFESTATLLYRAGFPAKIRTLILGHIIP